MKENKDKYSVNIVFDKKYEESIRKVASNECLPVATFIKQCVIKEIKKEENKLKRK